jgi:hypothetical protein
VGQEESLRRSIQQRQALERTANRRGAHGTSHGGAAAARPSCRGLHSWRDLELRALATSWAIHQRSECRSRHEHNRTSRQATGSCQVPSPPPPKLHPPLLGARGLAQGGLRRNHTSCACACTQLGENLLRAALSLLELGFFASAAHGGGPHIPCSMFQLAQDPGPETETLYMYTTEAADDGNYAPCQSAGAIAKEIGGSCARAKTGGQRQRTPCSMRTRHTAVVGIRLLS